MITTGNRIATQYSEAACGGLEGREVQIVNVQMRGAVADAGFLEGGFC